VDASEIRKIITTRETVFSEVGVEASRPITRAVGMAVIRNPFAGQFVEDLRPLFEAGAMLGERLMPELVKLLDGPAVSYGKGAIVGVAGEMEHGGAVFCSCCELLSSRFGLQPISGNRQERITLL
jgi:hypothetical protein